MSVSYETLQQGCLGLPSIHNKQISSLIISRTFSKICVTLYSFRYLQFGFCECHATKYEYLTAPYFICLHVSQCEKPGYFLAMTIEYQSLSHD